MAFSFCGLINRKRLLKSLKPTRVTDTEASVCRLSAFFFHPRPQSHHRRVTSWPNLTCTWVNGFKAEFLSAIVNTGRTSCWLKKNKQLLLQPGRSTTSGSLLPLMRTVNNVHKILIETSLTVRHTVVCEAYFWSTGPCSFVPDCGYIVTEKKYLQYT